MWPGPAALAEVCQPSVDRELLTQQTDPTLKMKVKLDFRLIYFDGVHLLKILLVLQLLYCKSKFGFVGNFYCVVTTLWLTF